MSLTREEFNAAREAGLIIELQGVDGKWFEAFANTPLSWITYRIRPHPAPPVSKARPHADLIKLWAEGAEIEYMCRGEWVVVQTPMWHPGSKYRVKEREFPKSSLPFETAYELLFNSTKIYHRDHYTPRFQAIADAAVKQYILDTEKKV